MSKAKLIVVVNIGSVKNAYATGLEKDFGVPALEVAIHSPNKIDAALRAVAARFDDKIRGRAEAVIAENRARIDQETARYRPRLAGKLYLFQAPRFLGSDAVPMLAGPHATALPRLLRYRTERLDNDLLIAGYIHDPWEIQLRGQGSGIRD